MHQLFQCIRFVTKQEFRVRADDQQSKISGCHMKVEGAILPPRRLLAMFGDLGDVLLASSG